MKTITLTDGMMSRLQYLLEDAEERLNDEFESTSVEDMHYDMVMDKLVSARMLIKMIKEA